MPSRIHIGEKMKFKKVLLILLSVIVSAALMSACSAEEIFFYFHQPKAADVSSAVFEDYGYQSLDNDNERYFYALFDYYVNLDAPEAFEIEYTENVQRLSQIADIYCYDHPEVFWVNEEYNLEVYSVGGKLLNITVNFDYEGEALQKAKTELNEAVSKIIEKMPENTGDFERELYFNDYFVDNIEYDENAAASGNIALADEHNAYGALVDKKCVCDGYAKAFKLLCDRVGVDSTVILGHIENEEQNNFHAWNCVNLDGEWYQLDITWNVSSEKAISYCGRYFNVNLTTAQIECEHMILPLYQSGDGSSGPNNFFVPECTATKYNYSLYNYDVLNENDFSKIERSVAKAAEEKRDYYAFVVADNLDLNAVYDDMVHFKCSEIIEAANRQNGGNNELSSQLYIAHEDVNRLIILTLSYE